MGSSTPITEIEPHPVAPLTVMEQQLSFILVTLWMVACLTYKGYKSMGYPSLTLSTLNPQHGQNRSHVQRSCRMASLFRIVRDEYHPR